MSLKCMIDKWLHKGQISQEEYEAVIKKLDGHDKQIRAEAYQQGRADKYKEIVSEYMLLTEEQIEQIRADAIDEFANKLLQITKEQMQKGAENE